MISINYKAKSIVFLQLSVIVKMSKPNHRIDAVMVSGPASSVVDYQIDKGSYG